ncbi:MAG: hypothetical protein KBS81_11970 [Spirochaetales bacterium]|nr:hypothetical protein [Candidatus Physcosoma equi]
MKLTGLLKSKVEEATAKEEKKQIIAEAGMDLTDEELDRIDGGISQNHIVRQPVEFKQSTLYKKN